MEEVMVRDEKFILLSHADNDDFRDRAVATINIPACSECMMPMYATIPLQLISYLVACKREIDVD